MEAWLADNALVLAGFIATGAVALWRISALERHVERNSEQARQDRRQIHEKLNKQEKELAELKGELRGRGVINGQHRGKR